MSSLVRPSGLNSAIEKRVKVGGDGSKWRSCSLEEGSLGLHQILRSFSAPISEEHAWAVIHQVREGVKKATF